MRTVTTNTTNQWLSGDYTGPNRPMARATIQKMYINIFDVQSEWGIQNVKANNQKYASAIFGQTHIPMELPNIRSIERNHAVDQDAASCTITLYNTDALPLGVSPDDVAIYDDLGKYTFNRGALNPSATNRWEDILVPDRVIRTYEGFGFNAAVCPEKDANLYPTGVWSIDDVRYTTDGLITIQCRDLAKLLIEQIAFPPVVPFEQYPLSFLVRQPNFVQGVIPDKPFFHPNYDTSSTVVGWNINGTYGHKGEFAFDNDKDTYWLSHGHSSPNGRDAFEWIQGSMSGDLQSVQVRVWGGPYRVYLSVFADGKWQGNQNIPYNHEALTWPDVWTGYGSGPDNGAKIKFLQSDTVDRDDTVYFYFKTIMHNVTKIRITFHSLYKSKLGDINHQYRCGVKGIWVSRQAHLGPVQDGSIGNYRYYEQIVELLLCYGGFWWPSSDQASTYRQITYSDGTSTTVSAPPNSFYLGKGRVWGDIMTTGAWGQAPLDPTVWDKKPLMDCINVIKDILGYNFFIDESGGAVFRLPNVFGVGNYHQGGASDAGYDSNPANLLLIDEAQTLINNGVIVSSRNVREKYFIANLSGKGALSVGYNPYPSGMRRIAIWTDVHFQNAEDCQSMADLLGLRALFTYRMSQLTIVAHPGLQIDDQVKVQDTVTGDNYIHRVTSIHSMNDLSTGMWTYDLETHWLGNTPFSDWVFDPANLSAQVKNFINASGLSNVTGQTMI